MSHARRPRGHCRQLQRQQHAHQQIGASQQRAGLRNDSFPLVFGEYEIGLAGQKPGTNVGANAEPVTEQWHIRHGIKALGEGADKAGDKAIEAALDILRLLHALGE